MLLMVLEQDLEPQIHIYIVSIIFKGKIGFIYNTCISKQHTKYIIKPWKFKPDSAKGW